jgi:hypothetical protein
MIEESDETEIERWKNSAVISEIAQDHVDMWNGYKEATKAEIFNQHILRSLTKTTASALMEGSNGKTPEGATRFVDGALQDSYMPRSANYFFTRVTCSVLFPGSARPGAGGRFSHKLKTKENTRE